MGSYINYWLVEDRVAKQHKGSSSPYIWSFIGDCFTIDDIRNKAIELFNNNKCDGILYRVTRENVHGQITNHYYAYYDDKGFHNQTYIAKIGIIFELLRLKEKQKIK